MHNNRGLGEEGGDRDKQRQSTKENRFDEKSRTVKNGKMALAYSSAESWGSQQFRLKSYSDSFAVYPPGTYPIILQLLPCKKLLEQACGISALLVLPCLWQDWTIQRCSDVLKWNKTKLAAWNLLSVSVTALFFPSAAWKQQSLHGKFIQCYLYLSHFLSLNIFLH